MSLVKYNALLTNNGYKLKTEEISNIDKKKISEDLTIRPESYIGLLDTYKIYKATINNVYLPRYYGIVNFSGKDCKNTKNEISSGEKINFDFTLSNFKLRELQKISYKYVLKAFKKYTTAILKLDCGVGKTILAIYLIQKLQIKTLVIVHKVNLLDQWKSEIEKYTNAKVGFIHRKIIDIKNKDIVLTTIHSVIQKRKQEYYDMYKLFGLTILDECHHLNMKEFCQTLQIINTKWMLGLTATPNKGNRMKINHVFKQFLGPIVPPDNIQKKISNANSNKNNIIVNILRYRIKNIEYSRELYINYVNKPNTSAMITNIGQNEERNDIIIEYIKQIIKYNNNNEIEKRKILVVSDRIYQLKYLHHKLNKFNYSSGLFIGGMTPTQLDDTKNKQIILGTYPVCEEGLNIKDLNTLINASPRRECTQITGRILRKPHKIPAIIIDIIDGFSRTFSNQGCYRKKYYLTNNYKIKDQKINDKNNLPKLEFTINFN
jgi:superfamily II DNA or RNA helicase